MQMEPTTLAFINVASLHTISISTLAKDKPVTEVNK